MPEEEIDQYESYRILRGDDGQLCKLGSGGMGTTYKAVNTRLDLIVALKVIKTELLDRDALARERFVREAKIAASIRHPNVATVYHLGEVGERYYYAMEFIGGDTLEERVARRGPFPVAKALAVADQAARALRAAHRTGLIHRDVKPANLMFTEEEEGGEAEALKLIDFGLAKSVGENAPEVQLTRPGQRAGFTALYGSPEQCQYLEADARSDIYSLGATLWFALVGQPPFLPTAGRKSAEQVFELQSKHVSAAPPLEALAAAGIPAPVRKLLGDMLEKDPAARPQTAAELRARIEECLEAVKQGGGEAGEPTPAAPYSFSLEDLLRQRGRLAWEEVRPLLAPLAAIADDLAASGVEALEKFTPRRVRVVLPSYEPPAAEARETRPSAALERPAEWPAVCADYRLEPRIGEESNGGETIPLDATLLPSPRSPRDAVEGLAALVYELLDGQSPRLGGMFALRPIPAVGEEGNLLLRDALVGGGEKFGGSARRLAEALAAAAHGGTAPPENRTPTVTQPPPEGGFPWKLVAPLIAFGMAAALVVHLWRAPSPANNPVFHSPKTLQADKYKTVQDAIAAAEPGDTVHIPTGVYAGPLKFKAGINLVGDSMSGEKATVIRSPGSAGDVLLVTGCDGGWISDLAFENPEDDPSKEAGFGIRLDGSKVFLRRCRVSHVKSSGIVCVGKDRSSVQECEVNQCSGLGIFVRGEGTTTGVFTNACHDNGSDGIYIDQDAAVRLEANVCTHNSFNGIGLHTKGPIVAVAGNRCVDNKLHGIRIGEEVNLALPMNASEFGVNEKGPVWYNERPGQSAGATPRTIQVTIDAAKPGETVHVARGGYYESLRLQPGVSLEGEGAELTIVSAPKDQISVLRVDRCETGFISKIAFSNGTAGEAVVVCAVELSHSHVEVRDCHVRCTGGVGMISKDQDSSVIHDCTAYECGQDGIQIEGDGTRPTLTKNLCQKNTRFGILVNGANTAPELSGNRCIGNGQFGIFLAGNNQTKISEADLKLLVDNKEGALGTSKE